MTTQYMYQDSIHIKGVFPVSPRYDVSLQRFHYGTSFVSVLDIHSKIIEHRYKLEEIRKLKQPNLKGI